MLNLKAGGEKSYEVFIGGERIQRAFAVWALWNGGPGVVGYYPVTVGGHVYRDPSNRECLAVAYRMGMVRVVEIERKQDREAKA